MTRQKNQRLVFFIGLLIGAAVFLFLYSPRVLDFSYDDWLVGNGGDLSQHYIGWIYYRNTPWKFPFCLVQGLTYPSMFSVTYMDSIPLFAVFFKLLSPILPETFQYFGLFGLLTYMLQGGIGAVLVYSLTENRTAGIIAAGFFALSPIVLQRMFGHTSLACHPIILTAIYLYFNLSKNRSLRKELISWTLLLSAASMIHIYFIPMVMVFICAYYFWDVFSVKWYKGIAKIFVPAFFTIILMFMKGDFYGSLSLAGDALGMFNSNLNALFNDQGTSFIKKLLSESSSGRMEEFSYLGMGILFLCLISLIRILENGSWHRITKKEIPLIAAVLVILALCIHPDIRIGSYTLFSIKYPRLIWLCFGVFQANGRFMWPVFYLVMTGCIVCCSRSLKTWGSRLLILALLIQILDLHPGFIHTHKQWLDTTGTEVSAALSDPAWQELSRKKQLFFLYEPTSIPFLMKPLFFLGKYAADHSMVMNDFYVARKDNQYIVQKRTEEYRHILEGHPDPDSIYIFDSAPADLIINAPSVYIYQINAIYAGTASPLSGAVPLRKDSPTDLWAKTMLDGSENNGTIDIAPGTAYALPPFVLQPGTYRVTWRGDNLDNGTISFSAGTDGSEPLNLICRDDELSADFTLQEPTSSVQLRCENNGPGNMMISGIFIQ